jgi:hypothetical protein
MLRHVSSHGSPPPGDIFQTPLHISAGWQPDYLWEECRLNQSGVEPGVISTAKYAGTTWSDPQIKAYGRSALPIISHGAGYNRAFNAVR